jgi:hypothetical protein
VAEPQLPSSCCRAPVSIYRTVVVLAVICPCRRVCQARVVKRPHSTLLMLPCLWRRLSPGRFVERCCNVLWATADRATSRNASTELKLEGCRRRRAMPRQRHHPQQNLSRATTQ